MSFTPYQVDYSVQNTAKNLGFSKKRVTFKFGFADETAIKAGRTGTDCRGSEHEVVFTWSLTSGKRQLTVDGVAVHFSESGQNGWTADRAWQNAFFIYDKSTHHKYKIVFISQPTSNQTPLIKPFDLIISGLSYFQFNPLFQLGTKAMIIMPLEDSMMAHHHHHHRGHHRQGQQQQQQQHRGGGSSGSRSFGTSDDAMDPEERRQLAAAKLASLRDIRETKEQHFPKAITTTGSVTGTTTMMKRHEEALISFDDDDDAAPPSTSGHHGDGHQFA